MSALMCRKPSWWSRCCPDFLHQPRQRRRLGPSELVDAARRRLRVCHTRSATVERQAYARLARADRHHPIARKAILPQHRHAVGLTMLAAAERTSHRPHCAGSVGPLAAEAGVEAVGNCQRDQNARHLDRNRVHTCPLSDDRPNANGPGTPREAADVLILQRR